MAPLQGTRPVRGDRLQKADIVDQGGPQRRQRPRPGRDRGRQRPRVDPRGESAKSPGSQAASIEGASIEAISSFRNASTWSSRRSSMNRRPATTGFTRSSSTAIA